MIPDPATALPLPAMRQIPSFLGAPIGDLEQLKPGDVAMVGLFLDHGDPHGFGKRFAARQIRYACAQHDIGLPAGRGTGCLDLGDLNVFPLEPARQAQALRRQIAAIAAAGAIPVVVGGRRVDAQAADWLTPARMLELAAASAVAQTGEPIALIVDLAPILAHDAPPRALSTALAALAAIPADRIAMAHLTGVAPDLDVGGRHAAVLAARVLQALVAHLLGAGRCR
jgi:arginase family enzyme